MADKALGRPGLDLIKDFESLVLYVHDDLVPMKKQTGKSSIPNGTEANPRAR